MLRTRSLLVLPLLALILGLTTTALPAEAAAKRPTVTLAATPGVVAVQSPTTLTGKVSGTSAGAKVRLERRAGGAWKVIKSSKVKRNKTFRFRTTVSDDQTSFRVKVVKSKKIRSATSKTVTVIGTTELDRVRLLILQKTNEFRAQNGLVPLGLMPELNTVAQGWSTHMATSGDFKHNPTFSSSYPAGWSGGAENIAAGQSPDDVVTGWINSSGHRANLLGDYNYIGIGYATGGPYGRYYTQNFAKYPGR